MGENGGCPWSSACQHGISALWVSWEKGYNQGLSILGLLCLGQSFRLTNGGWVDKGVLSAMPTCIPWISEGERRDAGVIRPSGNLLLKERYHSSREEAGEIGCPLLDAHTRTEFTQRQMNNGVSHGSNIIDLHYSYWEIVDFLDEGFRIRCMPLKQCCKFYMNVFYNFDLLNFLLDREFLLLQKSCFLTF